VEPVGAISPTTDPPTTDPWSSAATPTTARTEQSTPDEARADADELVARLRARRSASGVAAAYAAVHGHPTDPRPEQGARRWALTGRTAVVAVVAVLLLGVGVAALSLRGDGVEPLTQVEVHGEAAGMQDEGPGSTPATSGAVPSGPQPGSGAAAGAGSAAGGTSATGAPPGDGLLVHVVGEVAEPGLVTVPDGARVADALAAAGGTTRRADLAAVNLARTVVDGEQLYVPRPGEPVPGPVVPGTGGAASGAGGQSAPGGGSGADATVDINTADATALEALPGVGPSIAQAIVEWREANGQFASVDELEDVPGIGPATLAEIRDTARVGP
jgi:competence protein ComEA